MNFLRSGLKTIVGSEGAPSEDQTDLIETISRLVNRLLTASLADDRRDALRALRSLSKRFRREVGDHAMSALVRILRSGLSQPSYNVEVDCQTLALETLKNIFTGYEDGDGIANTDGQPDNQEEMERLTSIFLEESDSITILLKLTGSVEFPVRVQAVRLLTFLLGRKPKAIQDILLENHASIPKLVDLLQDVQEVIRNDAVLLLCELTDGNASIQKIVAFHSGFERLLNIISDEATSVISEDCLYLILQLLNGNPSNIQLFRENSLIQHLRTLLLLFVNPEDDVASSGKNEEQWTPLLCSTIIRALVSPSNSGELIASCQKAIRDCGLLAELCQLLMSSSITADVLSNVIVSVAETIRGNQSNQDFFESIVAPSSPPRPIVLILLISMTSKSQVFVLRVAALYCVQCYLYKNERGKHSLVETLLPTTSETVELTAGHLICTGLVSVDPLQVWLCGCTLLHCLVNSTSQQERLLYVKLAKSANEAPMSLMQQVVTTLLHTNDFQIRVALMMLLAVWLSHCPLAVGHALQNDSVVPYLLGVVRAHEADDGESLLQGMSAFLLGLCVLYNDDSSKKYDKKTLIDLVGGQLGKERFVEKLEFISKSEAFAGAARRPYIRAHSADDLIFDHEFCKLFRALEGSLCHCVAGSTALINGLPPGQADMHNHIVDEYKRLIKQQDEETKRLRLKIEELEKGATSTSANDDRLMQRLQQLEEVCNRKVTQQQLDALGELTSLRCQLQSLQTLLQQREAESSHFQQQCQAWQAYVAAASAGGGQNGAIDPMQAHIQELNAQLSFGWQMYEQQSQELARLAAENAQLKLRLDDVTCSLQLNELKVSPSSTAAAAAAKPVGQTNVTDYAALSGEHELLLELLSDQDQKIKELKKQLRQNHIPVSSDDDDEEDNNNEVDCCSPGAKAAAEKLRRYLGLVPSGARLDSTGYSEEYITQSSDLNCDFEHIESCRWRNVENGHGDDNDWYRMVKQDAKRWPAVIRPAYTPPQGNHLIIAGSENKGGQQATAVWISSPIRCQIGPGKLSFTYWIYGKATLAVMAVAASQIPLTKIAEVNPKTCTFREQRGTYCLVDIPPIDQPFQLAIQTYSDQAREGFAAVDDIQYKAEVCPPGSVQRQDVAMAPTPRQFATSASEANCDFESVCRWYNIGNDQYDWQLVASLPRNERWDQMTPDTPPQGAFAMINKEQTSQAGRGYLVSPARWKSGLSAFKVCALRVGTLEEIFCADDVASAYRSSVTIPGPINEPYELAIIGIGTGARSDSMAVDDIEYTADVCSGQVIGERACKALSCTFSSGHACNWILSNSVVDGQQFETVSYPVGAANNVKIRPTGTYFLAALIHKAHQPTAFIESEQFSLSQSRVLRMHVKRSTWGSELYVCRNRFDGNLQQSNCHLVAGPSLTLDDPTTGADIMETLSPQDTKVLVHSPITCDSIFDQWTFLFIQIYIVAHHPQVSRSGNAAFGIDSIDLLDESGSSMCGTSSQ
ncbi:General vesicular transport factor p115 [Trichuris trichiura]|uniref:General vesicular transport factor p115 n=1 Tax=Trichuris trichiura TaxID=36087 RepID=A0A077Z8D1_TRITR|nr:General vesicular transport factor p115 [Trichuris trichiura]